jgi:tetratricopeptide (TPR) repeat protein
VYEARIRLDDRSAAVRYHLGLAYYRDGRFDEAVATLERAAALDSRLAEAWYLMGICFRESNRIDDAIAMQEKAVAQSPGLVPAREELADLYGARGRYEDEIGQLQMLAGLDAGRIERRIAVGVAHARAGHIDLAILTLANALEPATDPAPVYAALGRVWLDEATRHNRPDALARALEALERAASASTATSETKTLYGKALRRARQLDAAERVLQQATERFPVDASAFAEYAAVAEQQQHFETARSALLTYASLAPDDENLPSHALTIGTLSLRLNDPATAVIWLERAVAGRPGDVRPLAPLVEAQLRSGNRDAARQAASRGLQIDPANVRLRALLRQLS